MAEPVGGRDPHAVGARRQPAELELGRLLQPVEAAVAGAHRARRGHRAVERDVHLGDPRRVLHHGAQPPAANAHVADRRRGDVDGGGQPRVGRAHVHGAAAPAHQRRAERVAARGGVAPGEQRGRRGNVGRGERRAVRVAVARPVGDDHRCARREQVGVGAMRVARGDTRRATRVARADGQAAAVVGRAEARAAWPRGEDRQDPGGQEGGDVAGERLVAAGRGERPAPVDDAGRVVGVRIAVGVEQPLERRVDRRLPRAAAVVEDAGGDELCAGRDADPAVAGEHARDEGAVSARVGWQVVLAVRVEPAARSRAQPSGEGRRRRVHTGVEHGDGDALPERPERPERGGADRRDVRARACRRRGMARRPAGGRAERRARRASAAAPRSREVSRGPREPARSGAARRGPRPPAAMRPRWRGARRTRAPRPVRASARRRAAAQRPPSRPAGRAGRRSRPALQTRPPARGRPGPRAAR